MANSYVTKLYRKNDKIFVSWIKKTGCGLDSLRSEQVPLARCLEKLSASKKGLSTISVLLKYQYDRNKQIHYFPRSRFIK